MSERALNLPPKTPEESFDSSFFASEAIPVAPDKLMETVQRLGHLSTKHGHKNVFVEVVESDGGDPDLVVIRYPRELE